MRRVRDPFGEALCAIRRAIREGRFVQGERLAITDLASELDLSATPVREALARLAGEGLIEDRRGQGYFAWRLDVVDLLELYELQAVYIRGAVEQVRAAGRPIAPSAWALPLDAEALFGEVVRWSASSALVRANRLLADRLAAPRLAEAAVLDDVVGELGALRHAGALDELLHEAGLYHARRKASAASIIAAMRSLSPPPVKYSRAIVEI